MIGEVRHHVKCFISHHFPFAEYTNVTYSTLRTCRPSCCFGQKLPAFHHLLSLNHSLCISLFSVWTLSPSQIPFSLPFLYFYHFLFPLLSVMLTACGISSSPCLSDPQAISRSLLHLSVSTGGLPHLRLSYRSRLTAVLQCFLSGSDICTFFKVVCFEVFKVSFSGSREGQGLSVSTWITSVFKEQCCFYKELTRNDVSPRWSLFSVLTASWL